MPTEDKRTDAQIVESVLSGDIDAFEVIVDRYQRRVFNLALRMTRDAADAEEISQEVFLKLYRSLDRYDSTLPLENWLMRIASNHTLNWLERRRLTTVPLLEELKAPAIDSPADRAERLESRELILAAIGKLPEMQRVAFVLKFMDDYTSEEIAEMLGKPRNTVKTWIIRARASLREQLTALRDSSPRGGKHDL